MNSPTATLRLISLTAFASMASMRVCDPMLMAVGAEFHTSTGDAAAMISAFAISYGVLQLLYGPLGDRIGKVRVIIGATFVCALLSVLTAMAPTMNLLITARALAGAAAAGIIPLSIAWVGDQVAYDKRQETLAKLMGATLSGMMVGQWFGGLAAQSLGWRTPFLVLGGMFLLAAVVLYRNTTAERQQAASNAAPAMSVPDYLRNSLRLLALPRVRWVLTVTALEGALAYGCLAFFPSRLVERFGFPVATAGGIMILFGIGGLLYSQLARRWLGLLGEKGLALLGGILLSLCLLVLAWSHLAWLAVASCFLAGLGLYMMHNTLQTQATQMAPESRGTAVTLFACVLFLGQSVGVTLVAGSLNRGQLAVAFSVAGAGLLLLGVWIASQVQGRLPKVSVLS